MAAFRQVSTLPILARMAAHDVLGSGADESVPVVAGDRGGSLLATRRPGVGGEARAELRLRLRGGLSCSRERAGLRGVVAAVVIGAAVCVLAGAASASVSPDRLLSSALAAANAQRSVHYVSIASSPTVSVRMVGDAALLATGCRFRTRRAGTRRSPQQCASSRRSQSWCCRGHGWRWKKRRSTVSASWASGARPRPLASVSPTPCMSVRRDRCCRLPRSHTEARIG